MQNHPTMRFHHEKIKGHNVDEDGAVFNFHFTFGKWFLQCKSIHWIQGNSFFLKVCLSISLYFLKTRELSRMLVGISNMAERCYMKHYGPLEQMTFQSKLDMIQVGKSVWASKIKFAQNREEHLIYDNWMKCKSKGRKHLSIHSNHWCHSVISKLLLFFHPWADPRFNALIPLQKLLHRPFHNSVV